MLELRNITKTYDTNGIIQNALQNVSVNFRNCEFASILGQSGSGKTTLLNIIGGLDQYTSGDLIINGISTKNYKDRDWDIYRNHKIGFIFQSYNLIPHQSVLENVELALTLSGVSKRERKKRAIEALEQVGLKEHLKKKPNQLSGGQMQRVAIARALVNDPDIILADEPTGALDSETTIQIMNIIKDISKNKLIIMVTHNPEIAKRYSSRIIKVKDGKIIGDTNPYTTENVKEDFKNTVEDSIKNKKNKRGRTKKTDMGIGTALSLSLKNLMSKKGRTILTSFAGSIGIIGIAAILALSNGVQAYIDRVQQETLSSYPITIEANTIDMSSVLDGLIKNENDDTQYPSDKITAVDDISNNTAVKLVSSVITNNLQDFKKFIEGNEEINQYVNDIVYSYNTNLMIYSYSDERGVSKVNPNTLMSDMTQLGSTPDSIGQYSMSSVNSSGNVFKELIGNEQLLNSQYNLVKGKMPNAYNEVVLVVNKNGTIPLSTMYALDFENRSEMQMAFAQILKGEKVEIENVEYDYDSIMNKTFKLVLNSDLYQKENNIWVDKTSDSDYMNSVVNNKGIDIKIVGILKVKDDAVEADSGFVGYNSELVKKVIEDVQASEIVKEQLNNPLLNVLTGEAFDGLTSTYESVLAKIGYADIENPSSIKIYPNSFESKEKINNIIEQYNDSRENDDDKIRYTDYSQILISSVSTITDIVSYVLIAFVAISLIVSSIMIAIITYISVLERIKEIGVLRAIGASKKDIMHVFNAETIIEGFFAGTLGVAIAALIIIPANTIIEKMLGVANLAQLPIAAAFVLIIISVVLTVIAGLIPAKMAAKKDPVVALRSE